MKNLKFTQVFSVACLALWFVASPAHADRCSDCKADCKKAEKDCKNSVKVCPAVTKPVCKMFKNFQCPAAGKVCRDTRCGLIPGCGGGGGLRGEPHMQMLDGLRYDYQGVGEYVIARSIPADVEVQARFSPYGKSTSVATMVGIRAQGHLILIEKDDQIVVDQQSVRVPKAGIFLTETLAVSRVRPTEYVIDAGGTSIVVRSGKKILNVKISPVSKSRRTWVGLLGNFDSNNENDFVTRDGKKLERKNLDRKALYQEFADSWRLQPGESFLRYGDGESTSTFTDMGFPAKVFSMTDVKQENYAKAEKSCREEGITGAVLHDCIYDILAVGDVDEVLASYKNFPQGKEVGAIALPGPFGMAIPSTAVQGTKVAVTWQAPTNEPGTIELLDAAGKRVSQTKTRNESPYMLRMPTLVGTYQIKFSHNEKSTEAKIVVEKARASVQAPDEVEGGTEFEVSWMGPLTERDYVGFGPHGETRPGKYYTYEWANRLTTKFQAPTTPGIYDLWYAVQGQGGPEIIDRKSVTVKKGAAGLKGPNSVEIGEDFSVSFNGPRGRRDYIGLYPASKTKPSAYVNYSWANKPTAALKAPVTPGNYVVQYIAATAVGKEIMATVPLVVKDFKGELRGPSSVAIGDKFETSVNGKRQSRSYVALVKKGETNPSKYLTYGWVTSNGNASIRTRQTVKPGDYELIYVIGGARSKRIVARQAIELKQP